MKHLHPITRVPSLAQEGNTTLLEQLVLLMVSAFFSDWVNYPQVIQFMQKYYRKTP